MKKMVLLAMGMVMGMTAFAQDDGEYRSSAIETTISGDIVSSYIWRGQDLGSAAIQPTLGVGYKGLSLSAWGSYGIADPADTKEFDLALTYTLGGFNIGITDYWFNAGQDPEARYFKYDAHGTNHVFEATIGYGLTAVMLRPMSHSNLPQSTGLLRPVPFLSPQTSTVRRASPSPTWH